ncbi:TPA: gas vesicle accessory protein GvpU [Aeromonas hydrophila]
MSEDVDASNTQNEQAAQHDGFVIDGHLATLVGLFNGNPGISFGITLTVGGTLISGQLISGKEYFDYLANLLRRDEHAEDSVSNTLSREMKWMSENIYSNPDSNKTVYIHLKDAQHYSGVTPVPTNGGYWRGRLCDVSGFTLGAMSVSQS